MKTLTRFSLATSIALLLLLTVTSLLVYARSPLQVQTVQATPARATATVDATDRGKPLLSAGSPVENVVFATNADAQQAPTGQTEPDLGAASADAFATLADLQLAALENGGKTPLLAGTAVNDVVFTSQLPAAGSARAALQELNAVGAASTNRVNAGEINYWYGPAQPFGNLGKPQLEINVLGSVITPSGRISATYSLNGGAAQPLSIGADKRRLAQAGDFNVEIDYSELIAGPNTVMVTATDNQSTTHSQSMTVNYTPGITWPVPYEANWANAGSTIQNVAQVVDGLWGLDGATVRPIVLNYDRLIAIGDVTWNDYEVVVPVTIHAIDEAGFRFPSNGPGVGLLLKWQGHYDEAGEQPDVGWKNFGALGWYRWSRANEDDQTLAGMQLLGYRGNEIAVNPTEVASFGTTYLMKMSVQSITGKPAYYRFKTWLASDPEPAAWDMEASGLKDEPTTGSLMLVAHHVDVTFGNVKVQPLSAIVSKIVTTNNGNGTVVVTPQKETYSYGEEVEILATGNSGFALDQWGGDLTGEENPVRIKVTKDLSISAAFAEVVPATISANVQGNGKVIVSPQKTLYDYDELVTITAIANPGFRFTGWSGSVTGAQNPLAINIRRDLTLTAAFAASTAPPISDDFNSCTLNGTLWTKVDPKGDSTITTNGQQLLIAVPANSDHNLFTNKNFAPRVLQATPNADFIVEAKFESPVTVQYQTQGIIIDQDNDNLIRMEFYSANDGVHVYAAVFEAGVAKPKANNLITVPNGAPMFMRVTRAGDAWTQEYSFDGITWVTNVTFNAPLTVTRSGVYGGNVDPNPDAADTSPAHTAIIDYFFNTASRIESEDGAPLAPTVNIVGNGTVAKNPDKTAYTCDEAIQLTATPSEGHRFVGWTGDITSTTNPLSFTLSQGDNVTATFAEIITGGMQTYLPIIVR